MATLGIYDIESYLVFEESAGLYDTLANSFLDELRALPVNDQFPRDNQLLDQISESIYQTEELWWVLMFYNNILDPLEPRNASLQVPSLFDVEELLLKYRQLNK